MIHIGSLKHYIALTVDFKELLLVLVIWFGYCYLFKQISMAVWKLIWQLLCYDLYWQLEAVQFFSHKLRRTVC